jgi:methylglyoxal synthase
LALSSFELIGTRHTAELLRRKVGLDVEELLSGPEGGDAQLAAKVAMGQVDVVFFFVDPLAAQPHDPDISGPFCGCATCTTRPSPRIWRSLIS